MSRRAILALSAAVSAFVLVAIGAAASYALRTPASPTATRSDVPADVVRAREAEYRRLIDEANARLRPAVTPPAKTPHANERDDDEGKPRHARHERPRGHHDEDDDG